MADEKRTNKDYVEFIEIDGNDSNSTIIVGKRTEKDDESSL